MEAAETFTITRAYAPMEFGCNLWAGFVLRYATGDVGLLLEQIFPNSPATAAGISPPIELIV